MDKNQKNQTFAQVLKTFDSGTTKVLEAFDATLKTLDKELEKVLSLMEQAASQKELAKVEKQMNSL